MNFDLPNGIQFDVEFNATERAVEFKRVLATFVTNAEKHVHRPQRPVGELQQHDRTVFAGVRMNGRIRETTDGLDRPEKKLQQINAMIACVNQRTAPAERRVLPKCARFWRIPEGKLGPGVNRFAQPSGLDHLGGFLMLAVKSHHERRAKLDARRFAGRDH